jgi:hypothetical protein
MKIEDAMEPCIHDYFRVVQVATGQYRIQTLKPIQGNHWNWVWIISHGPYDKMGEAAHAMNHLWRFSGDYKKACAKSFEIDRVVDREEATCMEEEIEIKFLGLKEEIEIKFLGLKSD